ncbi:MAG TPA: hypothetical protein VMP08_15405, partial [Anaerolineae bacterium]|nr:hypothetical protein [Anaerolineae bacterium]
MRTRALAVVVGGLFFICLLMLAALTQNARAADASRGSVPRPVTVGLAGPLAATTSVTCTVNTTTTSSIPNNYTAANAAVVATYSSLALVPSPTYPVSPTQAAQVPAVDNWF